MSADADVPTPEEFYRVLDLVGSVGRAYAGMYLERREGKEISGRQADEHFSEALIVAAQSREELVLFLKVVTWTAQQEERRKDVDRQFDNEVRRILDGAFATPPGDGPAGLRSTSGEDGKG